MSNDTQICMSPSATYKIRSPHFAQAFYVTIMHCVEGSTRRVTGIFINTKNLPAFQWVTALLESINSEIATPGCDVSAIARRLRTIFDPEEGAYFVGGVKVEGLVAHIGLVLDMHLRTLNSWEQQDACSKEN